jgi:hypothetical protein
MIKKYIPFIFASFLLVGCDIAMDSLKTTNGTKYIVTSKKKAINGLCYEYNLVRPGDKFYDYHYIDTAEFDVGDTLVLTVKKIGK